MTILKNQQLTNMRIVWDRQTCNLSIYGKFLHKDIVDKKLCGRILLPLENWDAIKAFNSGATVSKVTIPKLYIEGDKCGFDNAKIEYKHTYNDCDFVNEIDLGQKLIATKLYIPKHNLMINLKTGKIKQKAK